MCHEAIAEHQNQMRQLAKFNYEFLFPKDENAWKDYVLELKNKKDSDATFRVDYYCEQCEIMTK